VGFARCLSTTAKGARQLRCFDCRGSLASLVIARLCEVLPKDHRPLVAVVADETEARALRKDLQFFLGAGQSSADDPFGSEPVLGLPDLDTSPWADASPERASLLRRMGTLFRLSQGSLLGGQVIVASARALARKVVPRAAFADLIDIIQAEEELDRDQTIKRLLRSGYSRAPVCEDPGDVCGARQRAGCLCAAVPLPGAHRFFRRYRREPALFRSGLAAHPAQDQRDLLASGARDHPHARSQAA
jgi:transcription-repair coupling factor (superfamily II helicase)